MILVPASRWGSRPVCATQPLAGASRPLRGTARPPASASHPAAPATRRPDALADAGLTGQDVPIKWSTRPVCASRRLRALEPEAAPIVALLPPSAAVADSRWLPLAA